MSRARIGAPRWVLLAALLAAFAVAKHGYTPPGHRSLDGRYYQQIAKHVQAGEGLVSSVSLYHQGFREFPHKVNQSPVWPLTLGYAARLLGMERASRWVPEAFFFLGLVLLYLLANRLWDAIATRDGSGPLSSPGRILDFGHLAVAFFGTNYVLFRFTSLTYTEGMAFALVFAALLAADRAALSGRLLWAAGAGALAGLAALTRGQVFPLALAIPGALGLAGLRARRLWICAAVSLLASFAVFLPWILYLATWVPELSFPVVLGFSTIPETLGLQPVDAWVRTDGIGHYLADRWVGVRVAFDPRSPMSYYQTFGPGIYFVPFALLGVLAGLAAAPGRVRSWLTRDRVVVVAIVATGVGTLAPVHHAHGTFFREWLFAHRHGLPLVFLILPAAAALLASRLRGVRWSALALLVLALAGGLTKLRFELSRPESRAVRSYEREFLAWLDAEKPPPVVLTSRAAPFAVSSNAYFHWTSCKQSGETTRRLIEDAGIDYVLKLYGQKKCPFLRDVRDELELVKKFGDPTRITVYRPKDPNKRRNRHRPPERR